MRMSALGVAAGPYGVLRKGPGGLTMRKIRTTPGGIDLGPLEPRLDELIATKDRRVHLAPPDIVSEMLRVLAEGADEEPQGEFDLRLIGRRHLRSNNSWMHNIETMVKGRDRCTVLMHPSDAEDRDLLDGQRVFVASSRGQIEVPLEVSDEIRVGTVAIPHGWGHDEKGVGWSTAAAHPGANVNLLHDPDNVETFTGNGALNGTWVRVELAEVVTAVGA
jgi:anaerobic selenocysteine-containing dehydrogenase